MEWFELELEVPHETAEAVSDELFEMGAGGVTEDLNRITSVVTIKAYFPAKFGQKETLVKLERYLGKNKTKIATR